MKAIALGLLDDLRAKRLWPVALVLLIALVAVPFLLLEPSREASSAPGVEPTATGTAAAPDGLPGPEEALAGDSQALVTLATLRRPSSLSTFDVKNPFRPLRRLDGSAETDLALARVAGQSGPGAPSGSDPLGGGGTGGDVTGGGDTGTGGTGGGDTGGTPSPPAPTQPAPGPAPLPSPAPAPIPEQRLTYGVDLTFDGPESAPRSYRNLPRLSLLPTIQSPVLVFLGVGADANNAVFLVDSTLQAVGGDGTCLPSPEECATLSIEPGEQQTFVDEQGNRYFLAIDQIREVPVRRASRTGRSATSPAGPRTAVGGREPVRRFVLPDLVDLLVTGGQR